MFKKFKDKIGEELKQSPLRLSASVQQIAQAISPSSSASSLQETQNAAAAALPDTLSVPSDFFSIGDDHDNDSNKTLHQIDLTSSSPSILPAARSRRSSISSVASDVSSLFPIFGSPLNHSFLQSEYESEVEDGTAGQLEKISKEQLYQGCKKLLYRYNKYKGRFVDLSKLYKDLQYDNLKTKNVLQESQDKALRRVAELREQCQLEQKAKAHLEESLRNDLEEKDHIISTLTTQISFLKNSATINTVKNDEILVPVLAPDPADSLAATDSIELLKTQNEELTKNVDKLTKLLSLHSVPANGPGLDPISTEHVKEKITELKSGIVKMKCDNESISNLLLKSPSTSEFGDDSGTLIDFGSPDSDERDRKIEKLNNLLLKCKEKIGKLNMEIRKKSMEVQNITDKLSDSKFVIDKLNDEIADLRRVGDENNLTIAENKVAIHQELESKELQIKTLTKELQDTNNTLNSTKEQLNFLKNASDIDKKRFVELESQLVSKSVPIVQNTAISKAILEKEEKRLMKEMESMLETQSVRLQSALERVNSKIVNAEGSISRLCADRLITNRSTEMDLLKKIEGLECRVHEGGIVQVKFEDLEKEVKALQETVLEKQKKIDEDADNISRLNEELNEKIDRIVDLGNELDENTARLKIQLESSEAKQSNVAKEKLEQEQKDEELRLKLKNFEDQLLVKKSEIKKLTELNERLKVAKDKMNTIEKQAKEKEIETRELQRLFSAKEDELDVCRSEKTAIIKQHEKRIAQLSSQLDTAKLSAKSASEFSTKVDELEIKIVANEKATDALKLELSQKNNLMQELDLKLKSSDEVLEKIKADANVEVSKLTEIVDTKEREMAGIWRKLEEKCDECDSLKSDIDGKIKEKKDLEESLSLQLNKQVSEVQRLRHECNSLEKRLKDTGEQKINVESHLSNQVKKLESELASNLEKLKATKETFEARVSELSSSIKELESQLGNKERDGNAELTVKLEEAIEDKVSWEKKCREQCSALEETRLELSQIRVTKEGAESELDKARQLLLEKQNQYKVDHDELKRKFEEVTKTNASLVEKSGELNFDLQEMQSQCNDLKNSRERADSDLKAIQKILEEKEVESSHYSQLHSKLKAQVTEYEGKIESLTNELNLSKSHIVEFQQRIDIDSAKLKEECASKVNILKNEIKFLNEKYESEVANIEQNREREMSEVNEKLLHSENTTSELMNKLEAMAAERDELKQLLDEKSLKVSELNVCLSELKSDLDKNFNDKTKENTSDLEEIFEGKIKKVVSEYEMELGKRDDTIRDLQLEVSEQKDSVAALQNLRQEVRTLRKELKEKDDLIEHKQEEHIERQKEAENKLLNVQIDSDDLIEAERKKLEETMKLNKQGVEEKLTLQKAEFEEALANQRKSYENEIERIRSEKEQSVEVERSKCLEKVHAIEDSFQKERNSYAVESGPLVLEEVELLTKDMECTSKVAIAAVESSAESFELLQKKIILHEEEIKELKKQHKREVLELKKIAGFRSRRRSEREQEDIDVEHEYLRNILYEYMMGKEQMVLAKVLAAIVKFDKQQTQNILDKQQTSIGQLRIL